jgi:putative PEP-CTERM system TPR-repeat lipoprotein
MRLIRPLAVLVIVSAVGAAAACSKATDVTQSKQEFLARGNDYVAQKKDAEAIVEYRNAIAQDPKFGEARVQLAEAYLRARDFEKALREYVIAADVLPANADVQVKAAQLLLTAGRFEDARTRAVAALTLDPKNITAQILKGNASAGLKDINGTIEDVNEAIKLDPKDPRGYANRAVIELSQGRKEEAEASFRKAVEVAPTSPQAQMALANFLWSANRMPEAEAALKKVVELDPKGTLGQRALASFYAVTKRPAEAEGALKALAQAVNDGPSNLALADYYISERRLADATPVLQRLAKDPASYADATLRLAGIEYAQNHQPKAHELIDALRGSQPKNPEAAMLKAQFLMSERKLDEALALAKAAAAIDNQLAPAHYLVGSILAAKNDFDGAAAAFSEVVKINPRISSAHVQLAQLQLRRGASPTAVQAAEQAVQNAPQSLGSRIVLARSLMATRDLKRAESVLTTLIAERADLASAHAAMGDLHMIKKERTAARTAYTRASTLDPRSLEALRGLLYIDLEENNAAAARARLERELGGAPSNVPLLMLASDVYGAMGDLAKQEALLKQVIAVNPNVEAFGALAALYARTKRLDQARAEYEALAKQQPTAEVPGTMIGMILEAQNKPAEAQKAYERVVAAVPKAGVAANNLAWLYAEGGNLDLALQLAQSASQRLPNVPQVSDSLGWIYLKKDLPDLAIPHFEASVKAAPNDAVYRYHLGLAYQQAGDRPEAQQAFDEALRLRPDYKDAADARARLLLIQR